MASYIVKHIRLKISQREALRKVSRDNGADTSKFIRDYIDSHCKQLLALPKSDIDFQKEAGVTFRITKEQEKLLKETCLHTGMSIVDILRPLFESAERGLVHESVLRAQHVYDPETDCCPNEIRNNQGSCISCGDPCY